MNLNEYILILSILLRKPPPLRLRYWRMVSCRIYQMQNQLSFVRIMHYCPTENTHYLYGSFTIIALIDSLARCYIVIKKKSHLFENYCLWLHFSWSSIVIGFVTNLTKNNNTKSITWYRICNNKFVVNKKHQ